jgi:antagonist of KipI
VSPAPGTLRVLQPGPLATVQDLGRPAAQRLGVPAGGAMDPAALRIANRLAGNAPGAAAVEVTLGGLEAEFLRETAAAVAGADLGFELDGEPLPPGTAFLARRGSRLRAGGRRRGCRAWIAVHGGIDVDPVLGSRSTYLPGGFGGLCGRALRAGDELPARGGIPFGWRPERVPAHLLPPAVPPGEPTPLRVVLGPQDDAFTPDGLAVFLSAAYTVSSRSDRMGCRLEGPPVAHRAGADIVSDGVAWGAVQVPGDGRPIVLLADRQTTGGYAKIATVVGVDLGLLAQVLPGDAVRFRDVDLWTARELLLWREYHLKAWEAGKGGLAESGERG